VWGGIACGIFGLETFGGLGGVSLMSQVCGSLLGAAAGFVAGFIVFKLVDSVFGFRMSEEDERRGADLSIHKISANPEQEMPTR
ncbi:MAG: ammonium transporter, partial [Hyphomicrobiaceae bacterium]